MGSENIFTGKWRIVSLYCRVQGKGWTLFERYGPDRFTWEFEPENQLRFKSGETACEGRLKEPFKASPKEVTAYAWCPADGRLYIDRSDHEPDGFINTSINDCYRVEKINDTDYWLYDLEDVGKEPEDYRFRMKIKKHYL